MMSGRGHDRRGDGHTHNGDTEAPGEESGHLAIGSSGQSEVAIGLSDHPILRVSVSPWWISYFTGEGRTSI